MKDITGFCSCKTGIPYIHVHNPRSWAYTPAKRLARTDHLLDAWGDIFCLLNVGARLGINFVRTVPDTNPADSLTLAKVSSGLTFERFIETPHYYLQRMRSQSLNFLDDRRLDLWGDIFCKHDIGKRRGITFEQFLATPNYFLTLNEA